MSNAKTRIFCVITQGEMGGAQQFVSQLAHNLDADRFALHVIWGATGQSTLARALPPRTTYSTSQHLVRNISPWHDMMAVSELRHEMLEFSPDIVLCISSKAGFVGSLAARPLRQKNPALKVIYRIGGWTFNDPWPSYKRHFYIWLERFSARWKDYIVVNNTHDLDQAHQLGIRPRRKVVRIYNGLDPYHAFLPRQEAKRYLDERVPSSQQGQPYEWLVGTIANLYPSKDVPALVRAAARVGGKVRFVVMGDGQERENIERVIRQYDLQDKFILLGRVTDASKYLAALDVFVLPSVKEGFPWALLEAMAARVPVVATKVGAVPEMLDDGVSGILTAPGDAQQLAHGIVQLLGNDKLRQDMAIAAHQQVLTKFSLREMIGQYERLFS